MKREKAKKPIVDRGEQNALKWQRQRGDISATNLHGLRVPRKTGIINQNPDV
jgi:hypothetical protein